HARTGRNSHLYRERDHFARHLRQPRPVWRDEWLPARLGDFDWLGEEHREGRQAAAEARPQGHSSRQDEEGDRPLSETGYERGEEGEGHRVEESRESPDDNECRQEEG